MSVPALEVRNLVCSIGGRRILSGVDLTAASGETLGLIGPNGSGKTTLFNTLCGFSPRDSGRILLHGQSIEDLKPHERALLGLGRVFQNFGVFRELTVGENIILALRRGVGLRDLFRAMGRAENEKASEILESVSLSSRLCDRAGDLSGGQLRLLELARMIAFEAKVFLLDEPTAGVSPKMKDEVLKALLAIRGSGRTLLVVEHDLGFIESLAERVLVMDEGRVVMDGRPDALRRDPHLQEIYFGSRADQRP